MGLAHELLPIEYATCKSESIMLKHWTCNDLLEGYLKCRLSPYSDFYIFRFKNFIKRFKKIFSQQSDRFPRNCIDIIIMILISISQHSSSTKQSSQPVRSPQQNKVLCPRSI